MLASFLFLRLMSVLTWVWIGLLWEKLQIHSVSYIKFILSYVVWKFSFSLPPFYCPHFLSPIFSVSPTLPLQCYSIQRTNNFCGLFFCVSPLCGFWDWMQVSRFVYQGLYPPRYLTWLHLVFWSWKVVLRPRYSLWLLLNPDFFHSFFLCHLLECCSHWQLCLELVVRSVLVHRKEKQFFFLALYNGEMAQLFPVLGLAK